MRRKGKENIKTDRQRKSATNRKREGMKEEEQTLKESRKNA